MTMSLYYGGDAETPLARSVSFSEASGYYYGFKSYAVNAAGRYLIELTYPEEKFSATLACGFQRKVRRPPRLSGLR